MVAEVKGSWSFADTHTLYIRQAQYCPQDITQLKTEGIEDSQIIYNGSLIKNHNSCSLLARVEPKDSGNEISSVRKLDISNTGVAFPNGLEIKHGQDPRNAQINEETMGMSRVDVIPSLSKPGQVEHYQVVINEYDNGQISEFSAHGPIDTKDIVINYLGRNFDGVDLLMTGTRDREEGPKKDVDSAFHFAIFEAPKKGQIKDITGMIQDTMSTKRVTFFDDQDIWGGSACFVPLLSFGAEGRVGHFFHQASFIHGRSKYDETRRYVNLFNEIHWDRKTGKIIGFTKPIIIGDSSDCVTNIAPKKEGLEFVEYFINVALDGNRFTIPSGGLKDSTQIFKRIISPYSRPPDPRANKMIYFEPGTIPDLFGRLKTPETA